MIFSKNIYIYIIILSNCSFIFCIEPIIGGIVVGGAVASYFGWNLIKCSTQECCHEKENYILINFKRDQWIRYDLSDLEQQFARHLYGQPLVERIVPKLIKAHLRNDNPEKALVLSFNGMTGSGKNYASKLIARSLYRKFKQQENSEFVNLIIATRFNYDSTTDINQVKEFFKNNITQAVKKCKRSMFIIDEIDKMPAGIIDVIKPFLDNHPEIDGVDYRKSIFLFLSNIGGKDISNITYQFWKDGLEREDIKLKDLQLLISSGAFNEIGGLHKSAIVYHHLIDAYVPFLPLEKNHVKKCVHDYLQRKHRETNDVVYLNSETPEFVDRVVDELEFYPRDIKLYSITGCKKIETKVNELIDD